MISKKDKAAIEKSKRRIKEQIEATKKLDLGLDADNSAQQQPTSNSKFDGFIRGIEPSPLDDK